MRDEEMVLVAASTSLPQLLPHMHAYQHLRGIFWLLKPSKKLFFKKAPSYVQRNRIDV